MRDSGWAVAVTQPNAERIACAHLGAQGFVTFAPKFSEVAVKAGRKIKRSGFLFSRYVFVWIEAQWRSINGTKGVTHLITQDEKPVFLNFKDEAALNDLRARHDVSGFIDLSKPFNRFNVGQEVAVVGGPFYGFKGLYAGQSKQEREIVLLNMLGRKVRVEVDSHQLVA